MSPSMNYGSPPKPQLMKIDLHCHTEASYDCITPVEILAHRCKAESITIQAITDHNEIWGAEKLKALAERQSEFSLTIIIGEEISTREGEIIGLFLKEKINAGQTPEETIDQIKAQGGLVLLPHGFDPLKRYRLKPEARARIAGSFDIIESFNSRVAFPPFNQAAALWAKVQGLPTSAGSDAHTGADVGSAWVEAPFRAIQTPADLIAALKEGHPTGEWTQPVLAFLYKAWDYLRHKVRVSLAEKPAK